VVVSYVSVGVDDCGSSFHVDFGAGSIKTVCPQSDVHPACLSWYQATNWDPRKFFFSVDILFTHLLILVRGALSDEETSL
jgi:hypothetical protein